MDFLCGPEVAQVLPAQAASSPAPVVPPQAVDRDQQRIMQTRSWIKLVLGLSCRKGRIHCEHLGGPRANTLAVRRPGLGVAAARPGGDTGPALHPNNYIHAQ